MGPHMGILGSDHVIAYAVVTHPPTPRCLRNMLLGSNNTQMDIIEANRGVWVGDCCVRNHVSAPEDSHVGAILRQNSAKWLKIGPP